MNSDTDTTRRKFMTASTVTIVPLQSDGDGFLDGIFGGEEDTPDPVAVGPAEDRTTVSTDDAKIYIADDTGTIYGPDDGSGWTKLTSDSSSTLTDDTRVDVSDDGSLAVSDVVDLNLGRNLSASDDGDSSVTISASSGSGRTAATVTASDSPYTLTEDVAWVDTTTGAVEIVLPSQTSSPDSKEVFDAAGSASINPITVTTDGSETFEPGAVSSLSISSDDTSHQFDWDGGKWLSDFAAEYNTVDADRVDSLETESDKISFGAGNDGNTLPDKVEQVTTASDIITVPTDYNTIQAAVNAAAAFYQRHDIYIQVDTTQTFSTEDVIIPPTIAAGPEDGTQGTCHTLRIEPQNGADGPVRINSLRAYNRNGPRNLQLRNMRFEGNAPNVNENCACVFIGCNGGFVNGAEFGSDCLNGFLAYGSQIGVAGSIAPIDAGTDNLNRLARVKRGGVFTMQASGSNCIGNTTTAVYQVSNGSQVFFEGDANVTTDGDIVQLTQGFGYDTASNHIYTQGFASRTGNFEEVMSRSSDPSAPAEGIKRYYRTDLSPPEYRIIDENGTINTVATF